MSVTECLLSILTAVLLQRLAGMSVEPSVTSVVINQVVISVCVCIIHKVSVCPSLWWCLEQVG